MANVTPDFSESAGLVPGVYGARITGSEVKESKKGNLYVRWQLTSISDEPRYNDQFFSHTTMLTGKGAGMLQKFFKAATGEALADGQSFDTEMLHGREINVTLKEGTLQDGSPSGYMDVAAVAAR